jgi:hypothetical protein
MAPLYFWDLWLTWKVKERHENVPPRFTPAHPTHFDYLPSTLAPPFRQGSMFRAMTIGTIKTIIAYESLCMAERRDA